MHKVSALILCVLTVSLLACAGTPRPQGPRITLYAVHPAGGFGDDLGSVDGEDLGRVADPGHDLEKGYFHSYKILGQVDLTGDDAGAELVGYLEEEASLPQGLIAGCFEPRHALRVVRDGRVSDYLLCFACRQFDWYEGTDLRWAGKQTLDPAWRERFTAPLTEAGIELAE
jgi:hypothetical protein